MNGMCTTIIKVCVSSWFVVLLVLSCFCFVFLACHIDVVQQTTAEFSRVIGAGGQWHIRRLELFMISEKSDGVMLVVLFVLEGLRCKPLSFSF